MDDLFTEQFFKVNSILGLLLRKGPSTDTDKILRMANGSIVTRVNDQVRTGSELQWYNVRYVDEENDEIGWAASKYLELQDRLSVVDQPPIDNPTPNDPTINDSPPAQSPSPSSSKPKVAVVTEVRYNTTKKLAQAFLRSIPSHVDLGAVTYNYGGDKRTSLKKWNAAATPNSKLTA
jgi:hypothetical protein